MDMALVLDTFMYTFGSPFLNMLHIKFGFDWPISFIGDDV